MTPWYNPFSRADNLIEAASMSRDMVLAADYATPFSEKTDAFKSITLDHLFGTDTATMDRATAMSIASVKKIRNTACSTISRMPLRAYNESTATPLAKQPWIVTQPEAGRPSVITWQYVVDALFFYGRAWLLVTDRNTTDNRPWRVKFVPEWEASVEDGVLVKAYGEDVKAADVIRIDGPHEGLLNTSVETLREARAIDRAAARASDNPVPSVLLRQTSGDNMTDDEVDDMLARWILARRNGRGVGYVNKDIEATTMGQAAEQLLIDGRNAANLNIARACDAPAWLVDASVNGSSITYSNTPSRNRELMESLLLPYTTAIEARLRMNDILPSGTICRFDYSDMLRGDFAARMGAYKVAKEAGIYTTEELRRMELGLPLEGK